MNLGENIYNYRTKRNMSQGDLADALEVSRQSVSKWENNSAVPELEKLMKLAEVFEITLDELVTGEKAERPVPPQASQSRETKGYDPAVAFLSIPQFLIGILVFVFLPDHFISWWVGIPSLLAGVFVVLVGVNAYFEKKKSRPASTPVPTCDAPPQEHFPAKRIIGIIFLCCGLICAIVCIILAYTLERQYQEDMLCLGLGIGLPLALLGLCLLLVRRHTLLACGWILYLALWIVVVVLSFGSVPSPDTLGGIASLFTASFGATLSVGTLVQLWSGKLGLSLPWRIFLTVLILFMLTSTVLGMLPPRELVGEIFPAEVRPN